MKDRRPLHAALGIGATIAAWALGYLFVAFFRHYVLSPLQPEEDPTLFLPPTASLAWELLPAMLCLALAAAGSLATLYLIYRRDKDDFGRDYYNYALKLGSRWALFASLGALACLSGFVIRLWPLVRDLPLRPVFFWGEAVSVGAISMACLLWALVMRSQHALRLKLHLVAAFVLIWLAVSGQAVSCLRFYLG